MAEILPVVVFELAGFVESYEVTQQGGITFIVNDKYQEVKRDFIIDDQQLRARLLEYMGISTSSVQDTNDLKALVTSAYDNKTQIAVFFKKYPMHVFVTVENSDVPTFAYQLYYHKSTSVGMKSEIRRLVKFIDDNISHLQILKLKIFVFVNDQWNEYVYDSCEQIKNHIGFSNVQILIMGNSTTIASSQRLYRTTSQHKI